MYNIKHRVFWQRANRVSGQNLHQTNFNSFNFNRIRLDQKLNNLDYLMLLTVIFRFNKKIHFYYVDQLLEVDMCLINTIWKIQ